MFYLGELRKDSKKFIVFPHIRPVGIISHSLQMQVLLKNATFSLHRIIWIAGITRIAGLIWGNTVHITNIYIKCAIEI